MANTKSYYEILGIEPDSDSETVRIAVAILRCKDQSGSFTITLNNIESTLSDEKKRQDYDKFLIKNGKISPEQSQFFTDYQDTVNKHNDVSTTPTKLNNISSDERYDTVAAQEEDYVISMQISDALAELPDISDCQEAPHECTEQIKLDDFFYSEVNAKAPEAKKTAIDAKQLDSLDSFITPKDIADSPTKKPSSPARPSRNNSNPLANQTGFVDLGGTSASENAHSAEQLQVVTPKANHKTKQVQSKNGKSKNHSSPCIEPVCFNTFTVQKLMMILALLGLFSGIAWGGYVGYDHWRTLQQSKKAVEDLRLATKDVEQYIREYKIFPKTLTSNFNAKASYYDLNIIDNPDERAITLMFNDHAMKALKGAQLRMKAVSIPNLGLDWQCSPDNNFPLNYLPERCF